MDSMFIFAVLEGVLSATLTAAIIALCKTVISMRKEQRENTHQMKLSIMSMQKAEMLRIFQRVVEDRKPITLEELEHLETCYKAYHANGGNGTGTVLYNKIVECACVKTRTGDGND